MTQNEINVVETKNLTVSIGGRKILDGVTLAIRAGKFTGLIGPNGAGKTTLLKTLLGLIKKFQGSVHVFGHPPGQAHSLIGYAPQSPLFDPDFPIMVRDVVMMGRYARLGLARWPGKADRTAVDEAMAQVGVSDMAAKRFGKLSGGERQKVMIARALCGEPGLLLLDEPTAGVDALSQDSFYKMLTGFIQTLNLSILMVSHDIGVITGMVDDLVCLNQKVFCHGPPPDVIRDGAIEKTYGCEAELLLHGHSVPHRLVTSHRKTEPDDA